MSSDEEMAVNGVNGGEEEGETEELSGWADSMSKILKSTKPKNKKTLILSRARKDYEVNKNPVPIKSKGGDIEIAPREDGSKGEEGEGEQANGTKKEGKEADILSLKQQRKLELRQRKLERAWENLNRLTTEQPDREMETDLVKIATKGVVQLFNAVNQQQKTIRTKLRASRSSEFKKDKVLSHSKEIFDSAMTKSKILGKGNDNGGEGELKIKEESSTDEDEDVGTVSRQRKRKQDARNGGGVSSKKPVWQALQDDFMLDAKLKDWDKGSDSD